MSRSLRQLPLNGYSGCKEFESSAGSFSFCPQLYDTIVININLDHVRPTTDGTIFYVLLVVTSGEVKLNDYLLTAAVANVECFLR